MELISQLAFDLAPSLPEAQVQPLRGQVVGRVAEPLKPRETGTALVDFRFAGRSTQPNTECTERPSSALVVVSAGPGMHDAVAHLIQQSATRFAIPADGYDPYKLQKVHIIIGCNRTRSNAAQMLKAAESVEGQNLQIGDLISCRRLYSRPNATSDGNPQEGAMSWTKNSSLNLSQAPDKSPLILRLPGIFEAGYTFGPLDAVVGFLVYFERIAGRGPVIAELAERPLQGGVLPACSMSYDTSKEYGDIEDGTMYDLDWNVYHSRMICGTRASTIRHAKSF